MGMAVRTLLLAALAIALAPGCASLEGARLYASGSEGLERGDTAQAIAQLERAAELVPQASEVQNHLGLAYRRAGRDAEARRAFARAIELDCDNRAAHENLAVAELQERRDP